MLVHVATNYNHNVPTCYNKKEVFKNEVIQNHDVTSGFLTFGSVDYLNESLRQTGWGQAERELITALVREHLNTRTI